MLSHFIKDLNFVLQSQIFMASLPPESKIRLPVHLLLHKDLWKVISKLF